jgi:hypothetical protein
MKKIAFTILQLILFLVVFLVGSFLAPFHFERVLVATPGFISIFVADGILLMFALYILIVAIEVLRKRLRSSVPWTTLAAILAAILGLMMKFGFKSPEHF